MTRDRAPLGIDAVRTKVVCGGGVKVVGGERCGPKGASKKSGGEVVKGGGRESAAMERKR